MEPVETIDYNKGQGVIDYDPDPNNPRQEWDHMGHMVCAHDRYVLGDEQLSPPVGTPEVVLAVLEHFDLEAKCQTCGANWDHHQDYLDGYHDDDTCQKMKLDTSKVILKELYLYDHSGLSMSCANFDEGYFEVSRDRSLVGLIGAPVTAVGHEATQGMTDDQVSAHLENEVLEYGQYLEGDVYGVMLNDLEGNELDSLWGIYGVESAQHELDAMATYNDMEEA